MFWHVMKFRCIIWQRGYIDFFLEGDDVDDVFPIVRGRLQYFSCVDLGILGQRCGFPLSTAPFYTDM